MRRKPEEYNVLETKEVKYQGGGGQGSGRQVRVLRGIRNVEVIDKQRNERP